MIILIAACAGALIGGVTAARRKGNKLDIAQYAAGYGIAFALLGVIATIAIDRMLT